MNMNNIGIYLRSLTGLLVLIALVGVGLGSCDNGHKEVEQELKKKVIDIHDEIMPRMREIVELKEQLQLLQDNLAGNNANEATVAKVTQLRQIQSGLNEAENSMRTWMQEFKVTLPEDTPHESVIEYYEEEKAEISQVRENMLSSIDAAKTFIEVHKE